MSLLRLSTVGLALLLAAAECFGAALHHDLVISLDPAQRRLQVSDRVLVAAGRQIALRLGARFRLDELLLDGRPIAPEREGRDGPTLLTVRARADRPAVLEARYAGELDALDTALDHRQVLGLARPIASVEGAFLAAATGWYPHAEHELVTYRMKVVVPKGFRPVASGTVLAESVTADGYEATFEARDPLPGIDLMVGPYAVSERIVRLAPQREVRARTYFHEDLHELASAYLDSVAAYLTRYDASIGPYPHASYSVVSSPLPTGFGMPGIAYLGKQVLRLPFIRATSLGHEVLHDWWGNGVYPDYARGNWSEGLTTFLADYAFKEDEGHEQARAMRIAWLRDFAAVRPEQDRPLAQFVARRHGADQAVGYNKTAFVLFMLRDLIGEERFSAALRRFFAAHRFQVAGWDDLRLAFEAAAGRDLRSFFTQWISRPGAPRFEVVSAQRTAADGRHRLIVELRQDGTPFHLNLPLRVYLDDGGSFDTLAAVSDRHTRVTLNLPGRPHALTLDPETRVFRRLQRDEIAPILREVMLDARTATVVPGNDAATRTAAQSLARAVLEHVPSVWQGSSIATAPPLLVIGLEPDVADFLARHGLPALPAALRERGTGIAYARRSASGNAYAVVAARDANALGALARALPHLGAQSFVVFEGARSIERGVWPMEPRRYPVTDH